MGNLSSIRIMTPAYKAQDRQAGISGEKRHLPTEYELRLGVS